MRLMALSVYFLSTKYKNENNKTSFLSDLIIRRATDRYVKGVPFFNKRYIKGVPFLPEWYIKGLGVGPRGGASPY